MKCTDACMLSDFHCVWLIVTIWTVALQACLSLVFSRQEYWHGLPCPLLGNLSDLGMEPQSLISLALASWYFTTSTTQEASYTSHQLQQNTYSSCIPFNHSIVSDSLWPHGLQHNRPPCLSPTPRVYPNSCPLRRWCHPTISSSVVPFSSSLQSFPASEFFFPMCQLFASGGQSTGVSALTSVLPMNTQDWSPLGWTSWISLQSKRLSRVLSKNTVQKHQSFSAQLSLYSNPHIYRWLLEKP